MYDVASNICQALTEGASRVARNTALLGGGVYLLGEKAKLEIGAQERPRTDTSRV
jgi:hypothetical protein